MNLLPTHTCFDDTLEVIADAARNNPREIWSKIVLVHGIIAPVGMERFAHAWVEIEGKPAGVFLVNGERVLITFEPEDWEKHFPVESCTRYSVEEAWEQNRIHCTFGPWLAEYHELCTHKRQDQAFGPWPRADFTAPNASTP